MTSDAQHAACAGRSGRGRQIIAPNGARTPARTQLEDTLHATFAILGKGRAATDPIQRATIRACTNALAKTCTYEGDVAALSPAQRRIIRRELAKLERGALESVYFGLRDAADLALPTPRSPGQAVVPATPPVGLDGNAHAALLLQLFRMGAVAQDQRRWSAGTSPAVPGEGTPGQPPDAISPEVVHAIAHATARLGLQAGPHAALYAAVVEEMFTDVLNESAGPDNHSPAVAGGTASPRAASPADGRPGSPTRNPWHEYAIAQKLHLLLCAALYDEAARVVSQASATRTSEETSAAAIAGMGRLDREELLRIVRLTTRERPVFYVGGTPPEAGSAPDDEARGRGRLSALACMALLLRVMHPLSARQLPVREIPRDDVGTYSKHLGAAAAQLAGLTREDIAKCAEFEPDPALLEAVQWVTYFFHTTTGFLRDERPFYPPLRQADLKPLADDTLATLRAALSQASALVGESALVEPLAFEQEVEHRTASALTHARKCARVAATALHASAITDSARTHALRHLAQAMVRYTAQRRALGDPAAVTPIALAQQLARDARAHTAGRAMPDSSAVGMYVPCVVEALEHIVPALERLARQTPPPSALQAAAVNQQYAELSSVQAFLRALYPTISDAAQPDDVPQGLRPVRRAHREAAQFYDAWEAMRRDWNGEFGVDLTQRDGAMVLDLPQTAMQRPIPPANLAAVYRQARANSDADPAWRFRLDTRYGHALSVRGCDTRGRLVSYEWPDPFASAVSEEALAGGGEPPPESEAALLALSQLAPQAKGAIAPLANQAILAAIQTSLKPWEPGARLVVPEAVWLPANKALPLRDGQAMIYCRTEAGPRAHHRVCRHADGHYQLDVEFRYDDPFLRGPDGRMFRSAERLDVSVTFSLGVAADGSGAALVEPPMIRHWYTADAASLAALAMRAQAGKDTSSPS